MLAPSAPDTAELLTDGVNAALVPPGDVDATVARLRALAADAARASQARPASALRTAANLTWDARAPRIVEFLLSGSPALRARPLQDDPWTSGPLVGEMRPLDLHRPIGAEPA